MRTFIHLVISIALLAAEPRVTGATVVTSSWAPKGGQTGAAFGASVAPAGDVNGDGWSDVLVGAPLYDNGQADEGRAYLYLGGPNGLAVSPAWTFEPNQAGAHGGAVVASAGDVNYDNYSDVLVAAPQFDRPGHVDAGAVFVFYGSPQGLHAAPDDTLANDVTGSLFGTSVSFAGYTASDSYVDVVVGAPGFANGQANEGAVYVYQGSVDRIATTPSFTFESNVAGARAGQSVAGGGDVDGDGYADLVVGEPGASPGGHPAAGRMIVLPGSGAGPTATPIATIDGAEDSLAVGTGVAHAGDVDGDGYADVLVGVPGESGVGPRKGSFRCYRGTATGLDPLPLFVISGSFDQDRAGASVATAGDLDGDGYADFVFCDPLGFPGHQGVVNLFYGGRPNTAFGSFVGGPQAFARFGASAATAGDIDGDGMSELLVGAPDWSETGLALEGAAFLLAGRPALPRASAYTPVVNTEGSTDFGIALAIVPCNTFGVFPQLLVGESSYDVPDPNIGSVRRYAGLIEGFVPNSFTRLTGPSANGIFGEVVVDAGDVNRDGFGDFIVGAPGFSSDGLSERGSAILYLGSSLSWAPSSWLAQGSQADEHFAGSIAARGDVNGDGYADVAIGSSNFDTHMGKVSVYLGGPSGPGSVPAWTKSGTATDENFGYRLAMLDFDADGYTDLAVVAAALAGPGPRVDLFFGGPGGPASAAAFSVGPNPPVPTYGSAIAGVGDFDGDGADDLLVGAPEEPLGQGTVYLYPGSRGRSQPTSANIRKWNPGPGPAGAGTAVAGGGDIDGDGRADFVVGAPYASHPEDKEGVVYVFRGKTGGQPLAPDTLYESDIAFRDLGYAVAPLADLNRDGYADVVASATGFPGAVYAWLGGGEGTRLTLTLNESTFGGIGRYPPAVMDAADQFGWQQFLRSAAGRVRTDMQLEVRDQGSPFTGQATYQPFGLFDTGPPGTWGSVTGFLSHTFGLAPRVAYRVRGRAALNSPFFPHTRWVLPEGRVTEYDFRTGGTVTGVARGAGALAARLGRIAPNPARGAAMVAFELPGRVAMSLDVYDVRGRHVRTLAREVAGSGTRTWDGTGADGRRMPAGLYFVELRSGDAVDRGRIVLMN